jgi:hypothetical protein
MAVPILVSATLYWNTVPTIKTIAMSSTIPCPSCLNNDEPLVQLEPCGHFACSHCISMFTELEVATCYVCDIPIGHKPSSTTHSDDILNKYLDEISFYSDRVRLAFDATIAASNRSFGEYMYSMNRVRARLDDLESIAKQRCEEYTRTRMKHRDNALERIQAVKHHAQIYQDMLIAGSAADFTPPDCSFAASISPDDKCLQFIFNHEAVLNSVTSSSREYELSVHAANSLVTCSKSILRRRSVVGDILPFMTVNAKTANNKPVEDLCETDVVLQLLNTETDELLPEYSCSVVIQELGNCTIQCSLPAKFSSPEIRARLYVREVELVDLVVQNAFTITGVLGGRVPSPVDFNHGCIVSHAGYIYSSRNDGYVMISDISSGELIRTMNLPVAYVRRPIVITPEGYLYVLGNPVDRSGLQILIFSLDNRLLGSIALDCGVCQPVFFDLLGEDLLVVYDNNKVMHMKMESGGLSATRFHEHDLGAYYEFSSARLLPNNQGFVLNYKRSPYMIYISLIPGQPAKSIVTTDFVRSIIPCDPGGKEIAVFSDCVMRVIDVMTGITKLVVLMPFCVGIAFSSTSALFAIDTSCTFMCSVH